MTGDASVEVTGNKLDVSYDAAGLLANAPHAAHIHFGEQAALECPPQSADGGDGQLSTLDGAPFYGPVAVSLTTTGDTSPASVLAIDRYLNAPDGTISYDRDDIKTDRDVAAPVHHERASGQPLGWPDASMVVGTGVDPVTFRFSGGRSAN